MSRLASQADFFASYNPDGTKVPGTGLVYDNYNAVKSSGLFEIRADIIAARFPTSVGRVAVLGCGFGYLVEALVARGYNAWGAEAADWARNQAMSVLPTTVSSRIVLCNVANRSALNNLKSAAGLNPNNGRFDVMISEDVLTVCTNEQEAQLALSECRRAVSITPGRFVHFITCVPDIAGFDPVANGWLPGLLWRTKAQWRTIIGSADLCFDSFNQSQPEF